MRRVDPISRTGTVILVAGFLGAAFVMAHAVLVWGDWGVHSGPLHLLRQLGFAVGEPFHRLIDIERVKPRVLVNDSIGAVSYAGVALVLKRLLA
jgi:hypothetical protein